MQAGIFFFVNLTTQQENQIQERGNKKIVWTISNPQDVKLPIRTGWNIFEKKIVKCAVPIKCAGWNIFPYKSYNSSRKSNSGKERTRKN